MNRALQSLRDANPELYSQFVELLQEDLGFGGQSNSGTLECPNCHTGFRINLTNVKQNQPRQGKPRGKRRWNIKPNSLFGLLVQTARLQKMTTGQVSADFNKAMKSRIKGRNPSEVREIKIKWL